MGATYLAYSAFFVSDDLSGMQYFVLVFLMGIYMSTFFITMKDLTKSLGILKYYRRVVEDNGIDAMNESILLK
jgi:hypothetical protein